MGKRGCRMGIRRRTKRPSLAAQAEAASPNNGGAEYNSISAMAGTSKPAKKKGGVGARLWMRFDRFGQSEVIECDRSTIIKRASVPARDLRILGPIFSHSSNILDDNEDMAQLYLTRKWIQNQHSEVLLAATASSSIVSAGPQPRHVGSHRSGSLVSSSHRDQQDVEDLEMLLEAYFMQLDSTRNKILSVREYIDDTEDYVNIQLDNLRNELIQFHLTLTIASLAIGFWTLAAATFGMNIPMPWYHINGIFGLFCGVNTAICVLIFLLVLGYARWKKLIG